MYHNEISSEAPLTCSSVEMLRLPKACGSLSRTQIETVLGCGRAWSCRVDVDKIWAVSWQQETALQDPGLPDLPVVCKTKPWKKDAVVWPLVFTLVGSGFLMSMPCHYIVISIAISAKDITPQSLHYRISFCYAKALLKQLNQCV